MSKKWTPLLVIVLLIILAFVGVRLLYFGPSASAYTPPERELADVGLEVAEMSARIKADDNPSVSQGVVVVDYTHRNALFLEELNVLFSKIVSRGFSYEVVTTESDAEDSDESNGDDLASKLRYAKALILPLPRAEYTEAEIAEIERFVEKGGQVLIIGDPTRTVVVEALNSIAGAFDIIYANDYLYSINAETNDNNYRNVIYTNFRESPLTKDLDNGDKIIFYSGGSVNAPGHEIILGNEDVHSSISEGGRTMSPAVLTTNEQVLALGDLTFLGEPYSAAESNGTLINNIANFLTGGERSYELKDFPYFFNNNINVVFDDTLVFNSQFEDSVKVKEFLEETDRTVTFTDEIAGGNNDVIFVGRFDQTEMVADYLAEANISILEDGEGTEQEEMQVLVEEEAAEEENGDKESDTAGEEEEFVEGRIQIKGVGELERGGSTLFYLHQDAGRNTLIILSDNPDTNADAFELLLNNELADCAVSPNIAVCQTEEPDKRQLPSVRSTRIDKILVVSDDDGRPRADAQTSAQEYRDALDSIYKVDIWVTSDGDELDLDELQVYDAIIWTTGDYWDDSIGEEDADLLTQYIEAGGNLILSGASIAFDWDHTDFLENIAHADYITFAPQQDVEIVLADHPIAKDFAEGDVITFVETSTDDEEEPLEPDVVAHTPNSRVVLQRGPESEQAGAAAVIAYEDDRSKIAYFAFPVYLLPAEEQAQLVNNTIDWFTRKPLDLPDEDDYEPFNGNGQEAPAEEEEESSEENGGDDENGEETENNEEG